MSSALDRYVRGAKAGCLTVHERRQALRNLDRSACYDILQRLSDSQVLLMELKIFSPKRRLLPSFDEQQHVVNSALYDAGVPIHYGYNLADDYVERNDPIYTLERSNAATPDGLFVPGSRTVDHGNHHSVRRHVDTLLRGEGASAIAPLFAEGVLSRNRQINTSILLLAYNAKRNELERLDRDDLVSLRAGMARIMKIPQGGGSFDKMTRHELGRHLTGASRQITAEIEKLLAEPRPKRSI